MFLPEAYLHFSQRLVARYGINIDTQKYKELCNGDIEVIQNQDKTDKKLYGLIRIDKDFVLVIYKQVKGKNVLITALPKTDQKYPASLIQIRLSDEQKREFEAWKVKQPDEVQRQRSALGNLRKIKLSLLNQK